MRSLQGHRIHISSKQCSPVSQSFLSNRRKYVRNRSLRRPSKPWSLCRGRGNKHGGGFTKCRMNSWENMSNIVKSSHAFWKKNIIIKYPRNRQPRRLHQLRGHLRPQALLMLYESARSEPVGKTGEGSKQTNHCWSLNQTNYLQNPCPPAPHKPRYETTSIQKKPHKSQHQKPEIEKQQQASITNPIGDFPLPSC